MKNASIYLETNAKGIERQSVVSKVILCLLCKWSNEKLNALIWLLTKLVIIPCYAQEIHTFENKIQTSTTQFPLSMRTLAKVSFSNFSVFSLSCIHFALGLLTSTNAKRALKGYSEFCLNIEQDRHFRWTSSSRLKPWYWKAHLTRCQHSFKRPVWFKRYWALVLITYNGHSIGLN